MTTPEPREIAAAALVALPGMTPAGLADLLERWPDPVEAAAAVRDGRAGGRAEWRRALDLDRAEAKLAASGARVLVAGDPGEPIPHPYPDRPRVLLGQGQRLDALAGPCVAVVGTRAATPHGLDDASAIAAALVEAGVVVVSGMAIGIDGAAHQGALDAGGLTVGVLATGLDVVYPRRHEVLSERVRRSGALVTECDFGVPPRPERFPVRNRIIAAMSRAVVVVEATRHGGARITADIAMRYGVDVFAVPGSRRNASAAGCNALIADGAHPLLDPSDVLVNLGLSEGASSAAWRGPERPLPAGEATAVHRALGGEPATCDQLASRTGLTPPKVALAVARLERDGWARRSRGMVWPC